MKTTTLFLPIIFWLLQTSCGAVEPAFEVNERQDAALTSPSAGNADAKGSGAQDDLTLEEIETCLNSGGVAKRENGVLVCSANKANGCEVEVFDNGVQVDCGDGDVAFIEHGKDGTSCTAMAVDEGVEIQCGEDAMPLLVRHGDPGMPGKPGEGCDVAPVLGGAEILCGNDEPVFLAHGEDGEDGADGKDGVDGKNGKDGKDGEGCTVVEQNDDAIITCGSEQSLIAIKHSWEPEGVYIEDKIDPCGKHSGFDEILLKMSDGTYVAYFESGRNRFLVALDPNTQHGWYRTTDRQRCKFRLHRNGAITW